MQNQHRSRPAMDIPILEKDGSNYNNYKHRLGIWCLVSGEPQEDQAFLIQSKLGEKAFDITKGIDHNLLKSDGGVDALIQKLDEFYIPDKLLYGRQWCDKYRDLKRRDDESVIEYIQRFLNVYEDFKKFNADVDYPDHILAWDLIRSLNLSMDDEKIVTAQMKYPPTSQDLIGILKRVFTNKKVDKPESDYSNNKASDIFLSKSRNNLEVDQEHNYPHSSLYAKNNRRPTYRPPRRGRYLDRNVPYNRYNDIRNSKGQRQNIAGPDGKIRTCSFCNSEWHFLKDCTELHKIKNKNNSKANFSLISFVGCANKNNDKMKDLLDETKGYALLDSGCSNTVAGEKWIENFIENLSAEEKTDIKIEPSNESFTFGDGITKPALRRVTFPCWVGGESGEITADVVDSKIPLLLSRRSMSRANMTIDFAKHTATINGRVIKLKRTRSGHYGLPISL